MSFSGIVSEFSSNYGKAPKRVKLIDAFAGFQLATAVIQVSQSISYRLPDTLATAFESLGLFAYAF